MACYNSEDTVRRSIDSILGQSFKDFEFIIVNDASIDNTGRILDIFAQKDNRIKILKNGKNEGLAYSLNFAFQNSNGYLIARMDADDIAFPHRLEKQVKYFNENCGVSVLGSAAIFCENIHDTSKNIRVKMPKTHTEIIKFMYKSAPFIHPTVMMKRDFFQMVGGYDKKLRRAQDYDMWLRGRNLGTFKNLEEELIYYSYDKKKSHLATFSTFLIKIKSRPNLKELGIAIFYSSYEVCKIIINSCKKIRKNRLME